MCSLIVEALPAQTAPPRVVALPGPAIELGEPVSNVGEFLELADGRVLISDFRERRLLIGDLRRHTLVDAARTGSGPREFQGASPIIRGANGEVLVWDVAQDRVLVLSPLGVPQRTRAADSQGAFAILPRAADASGRLYGEFRDWVRADRGLVQAESAAVIRISGRRRDTLALIQPLMRPHRTARDRFTLRASGFATQDAWGVFPDGRLIVVRGATYLPELVLPDGSRRAAAAISFRPLPVTARDRQDHMAEAQRALAETRRNARSAAAVQHANALRVAEPERWPQFKPPLRDAVILIDAKQRAWISVYDADESSGLRYDLLDRNGVRVGAVRLPRGERLIGFGNGTVYTVRIDEDDLSFVRRYSLPQ
ncbi:hypothetical protein Strain138_002175 [Pseudogemmatithrix spongiicola]|uniref:6-bladed beta-propeller n=1 Tax=Pseudogemmatithrix spongiicola TaxID=3062599 RepID=A0AA49K0Z8_9BACT|nr:hypothetical protein Strain138_002175 [Gemmatimonadaceae bacterium 'strain 138']WKW15772.1 hypothetical protein Strain318_002174 [Gemmatimonadaceae bacterium 'strain 318']